MRLPTPIRSVRRYIGRIRSIRDEIRTERFMSALPDELRKDIGWPDRLTDRAVQRQRSLD